MKKYIDEIKETIQDCWDIDGMSERYRNKLLKSLNCIEAEFLELHKHFVVKSEAAVCWFCGKGTIWLHHENIRKNKCMYCEAEKPIN